MSACQDLFTAAATHPLSPYDIRLPACASPIPLLFPCFYGIVRSELALWGTPDLSALLDNFPLLAPFVRVLIILQIDILY